jgi:hypothetical protein
MYRPSQKVENQTSRETVRKRFDDIYAKAQVTDNEHLTAAIYAPLLLRNHEQDMDIRKQISNCWDFCNRKDWKVKYVFIEQCKSGNTPSESESHQILEKAKAENLDFVVFWELRFSRVKHIKVKKVAHTPRQSALRCEHRRPRENENQALSANFGDTENGSQE